MKRSYIGLALSALVAVGAALILPSCGFQRKLVSITVTNDGATITGPGLILDFKAYGTYVHPPDTEDITNSVVWASSVPQAISIVSNTGVATSGRACGTNVAITASAYSNPQNDSGSVVVGTALVTVDQPGNCQ
ncbi:MAG: hypothetical protein WCF68_10560 [Terriglobales bacterium]